MITAVVDRIEGDKVILLLENKQVVKNLHDFKSQIKEGDIIDLKNLTPLNKKTNQKRSKVDSLLEKLFS